MKRILTSFALVAASLAFSQVSVSGDDAHTPEATLDVKAIGGTTTADGVLIPRVDRARAQNMPNVKHSTLIYVDDISNGAQSGKANQIDAKGFYYFDTGVGTSGEWVKFGGGASSIYSADVKYRINFVGAVEPDSFEGYDAVVFTSGSGNKIPDPTNYSGKSIILINNSTVNVTLQIEGGADVIPSTGIRRNTSLILVSDGSNWYRLSS